MAGRRAFSGDSKPRLGASVAFLAAFLPSDPFRARWRDRGWPEPGFLGLVIFYLLKHDSVEFRDQLFKSDLPDLYSFAAFVLNPKIAIASKRRY